MSKVFEFPQTVAQANHPTHGQTIFASARVVQIVRSCVCVGGRGPLNLQKHRCENLKTSQYTTLFHVLYITRETASIPLTKTHSNAGHLYVTGR
jgi:uncharacterized membrane protein YozB (DUF420 family)